MTEPQSVPPGDPLTVLAALGARLDELVDAAGPARWNTDTPAAGALSPVWRKASRV